MKLRWPAVAFDLDGLLLDSEPFFLEAARRLLAKRGVTFDATFMLRIMGMPGRDSLPIKTGCEFCLIANSITKNERF